MNDLIELKELVLKSRPDLKQTTVSAYILSLAKISRVLHKTSVPKIIFFKNYNVIIKYLDDNVKNIATRKNILTAIIVLVKIDPKRYGISDETVDLYCKEHKRLSLIQKECYDSNIMSDRDVDNWICLGDIKKKRDEIEEELKTDKYKGNNYKLIDKHQQFLILLLYTELPPLRNEYANVIVKNVIPNDESNIVNVDSTSNYIDLENKILYLCNYKTNKTYGVKKIDLGDYISKEIVKWMGIRKKIAKVDNDWLLINILNHKPMKKYDLYRFMNRIFSPKKISSTLIRKAYLSEKYPVIHTNKEMERDSYIMGHSVHTQQTLYRKKL